ncbi:MAG: energy transducer TonB [Acidobacteriota bacterium]|nr:energy transducer TonB [Acidobacteriota bacterium]
MHKFVLVLIAGAATLFSQTTPPDVLNQGVKAFKAAKYTEAVDLFRQAAAAAPADPVPHLYLATALMSQYIPGTDSPENQDFASNAEREFQAVLGLQPDNQIAIHSLASLNYSRAMSNPVLGEKLRFLDESASWYEKLLSAHPEDRSAHYSLGVIAWSKFYPELMQTRQRLGMRPEDPGPLSDATARADLRSRFGTTIEQGMRHLDRALELDPAYDDAMAYLNLLYRERADLYDTAGEYKRDVQIADDWVKRALDAKKAKTQTVQLKPKLGDGGQVPAGVIGGVIGSSPSDAPPPPNVSSGAQDTPKRIRVGGNVQAANLIEKPEPDYPALARQARIQGTVRYNVIILNDGTVGSLTLVSGHPLLIPAATEAVRRYRYRPVLLNGQPVEVITEIQVGFVLTQ